MIVDDGDEEIEVVSDPFLDAGIDIPEELPYQPEIKKETLRMRISKPKHIRRYLLLTY